jgi:hypothetical protein
MAGDVTAPPDRHTIFFGGEYPCRADGSPIEQIRNHSRDREILPGLTVNHEFSAKPKPSGKYDDYHSKVTTYITILGEGIDPSFNAKTFPVIKAAEEESVFKCIDTASSRADIVVATRKLEIGRLAIVGLGGTGSYVLDLVAKTPVKEIHLFDGDTFLQHNAFRSPGAPSIEDLAEKPPKVSYFACLYSKMRRRIVEHAAYIDETNVDQLREMDFVFLCLDRGGPKKLIVQKLEEFGVPFIEVGMGVDMIDESLSGVLRVTCSTPAQRDHVWKRDRIPFSDGDANNDYARNIQIADLNALNAALAVIKWKKLCGFYADLKHEHFSAYMIDGNTLINEDRT